MKYSFWLVAGVIFFSTVLKDPSLVDVLLATFVNVTVTQFFPDVIKELKRIGK